MNLKEKIKNEINSFIDGLDVEEESIKEEIEVEEESVKEDVETTETTEAVKEDGDGDSDGEEGEETEEVETPEGETEENVGNGGNGTGKKEEVEAKKEDVSEESEKSESNKCGGKTKTIYGRTIKPKESQKEETTETESDKEVLYLAQDEVENLISTTLRRYAEEVEQMVFDGIQEALDDYLFSQDYAYKEDNEKPEEEEQESEPEEVEEESQKEYATPEMVKSMFDEQFASFKSSIMNGIKEAQKESIKSYSKAINPSDDGFQKESDKESFTPKVQRDFNGCRIRKR